MARPFSGAGRLLLSVQAPVPEKTVRLAHFLYQSCALNLFNKMADKESVIEQVVEEGALQLGVQLKPET